jgi:hypothetical protein
MIHYSKNVWIKIRIKILQAGAAEADAEPDGLADAEPDADPWNINNKN